MPLVAKRRTSFSQEPALFDDVARILAGKLSTLFQVNVLIVDDKERVIARGEGGYGSQALDGLPAATLNSARRLSFQVNGRCAQVLLGPLPQHCDEPQGVLEALIKQLIYQIVNEPIVMTRRSPKDSLIHDLLNGPHRNEMEIAELAELLSLA